jgi:tetratricopeptide (TPR) repeat protein
MDFAKALAAVESPAAAGALEERLDEIASGVRQTALAAVNTAANEAEGLAVQGKFEEARRRLGSIKVPEGSDLAEELARALAGVDEAEATQRRAEADAERRRAEAAYAELCRKVDAELKAFRPDEADRLLRSARHDPSLRPLSQFIAEDRRHVAGFADVLLASHRGIRSLAGRSHSFSLRDGTKISGVVRVRSSGAVEIESRMKGIAGAVVTPLDIPRIADEELSELALRVLDAREPSGFLKLAVFFAASGDLDTAREHLEKARDLRASPASVAAVERRWLKRGDEARAAALLAGARRHFAERRYAEAKTLIDTLTKELSHTEVYRTNYAWKHRPAPKATAGGGKIVREYWKDIPGKRVADLTHHPAFQGKPTGTDVLTSLQGPTDWEDNYGARIRGYVNAPTDGIYYFWISSDNQSELWLSTDESPANRRLIARVVGETDPLSWDEQDSQKSRPLVLKGGRRYYIEVLHKEEAGEDHLAVGWQLPTGHQERPIPASRLSSFTGKAAQAPKGERGVLREYWAGVEGNSIAHLTGSVAFPDRPTRTDVLGELGSPEDRAERYGQRLRGYVVPPVSGEYIFWITSDDHGELWLSQDENPANRRLIASLRGYAKPDQWAKAPSQRSAPVRLVAGKKYYVEVLHKEGGGVGHVGVRWGLPDGTIESPVPGERLLPFGK